MMTYKGRHDKGWQGLNASGCETGVSLLCSTTRGSGAGFREADGIWER